MLADFEGRHVLLLQGPNGPFFRRVGAELSGAGAEVSKINLNAADAFFYPSGTAYRGTLSGWKDYLDAFVMTREVDCIFLFGDCRPYHEVARQVAAAREVDVYVFEEGYLRPDYFTVERGGVNRNSSIPRDLAVFDAESPPPAAPRAVQHAFAWSVLFTILNSFFVTFFWFLFPHYRHHRDVNFFRQTALWARSMFRRVYFSLRERHVAALVAGPWSKTYFLVGLQVHNDFQVKNSRFRDVEEFVREVVATFAQHADQSHRLVIKHHPADRAYRDYGALVAALALAHGLEGRLLYVHDVHLPALLRNALGTVVINSTVGLSSLFHHTPVMALDEAVYSRMGLAARGSLAEFFVRPEAMDPARYKRARAWLVQHNQANGSIWVRLPGLGPAGVIWPENFGVRAEASGTYRVGKRSRDASARSAAGVSWSAEESA